MSPEERDALVARYAAGADAFEAVLQDVTEAELDAQPADGGWSVREITHHLCDGELNAAVRLRRLIAEDEPVLPGYDEVAFSQRLFYAERSVAVSLAAMRAARASTLEILERLGPEQWARQGRHSDRGAYGVEAWLEDYAAHPHDHADQARRVLEDVRTGDAG